jgi:hypothetical protein
MESRSKMITMKMRRGCKRGLGEWDEQEGRGMRERARR